jgi:hypothetical protein
VTNEFERIWKEAVVVKFEVLSWHLPAVTEEKHKKRWSGWLGFKTEPGTFHI